MTRKSGQLTNSEPKSGNLTYDARYGSVGWKPRQRRKWNRKLPPIHPTFDMPATKCLGPVEEAALHFLDGTGNAGVPEGWFVAQLAMREPVETARYVLMQMVKRGILGLRSGRVYAKS